MRDSMEYNMVILNHTSTNEMRVDVHKCSCLCILSLGLVINHIIWSHMYANLRYRRKKKMPICLAEHLEKLSHFVVCWSVCVHSNSHAYTAFLAVFPFMMSVDVSLIKQIPKPVDNIILFPSLLQVWTVHRAPFMTHVLPLVKSHVEILLFQSIAQTLHVLRHVDVQMTRC